MDVLRSREDFKAYLELAKKSRRYHFDDDDNETLTKVAEIVEPQHVVSTEIKNTRKTFARSRDQDAFVDNDELLKNCNDLAKRCASENIPIETLKHKISIYTDVVNQELSATQLENLVEYTNGKIKKHQATNPVEVRIIKAQNKNLLYFYIVVKHECLVGETICKSQAQWQKDGKVRKADVPLYLKKLVEMGALACVEQGEVGTNKKKASVYRRLI